MHFSNTGVNLAGPLYIKDIYGKNDQMFKSYIFLFTCASTRNVHLELTTSMDASDVCNQSLSTVPFKKRMHQNVNQ